MADRLSKPYDQLTPADLALSPCWHNPDPDRRAVTQRVSPAALSDVGDQSLQEDPDSHWAVDLWPADPQLGSLAGVVQGGRRYQDPWTAAPRIVLPGPLGDICEGSLFNRFSLAVESMESSVVRLALPRLSHDQPRFGPSRHDEAVKQASAVLRAMGTTPAALFPLRCVLRVPLRGWPAEFTVPGFMTGPHAQEHWTPNGPAEFEVLALPTE